MSKIFAIIFLCYGAMVFKVHSQDTTSRSKLQNELDYESYLSPMSKFFLYTNKNSTDRILVNIGDEKVLKSYGYDSGLPTKFIIHGWRDSIDGEMNDIIRPAFLKAMHCNVFAVDWKKASYQLYAIAATRNVYTVGKEVARFIEFLITYTGLELRNIHLIGHSLGSHISGLASSYLVYGKVSRITGLDVALPLFQMVQHNKRLSNESAEFVEVFHTNGGMLGFKTTLGHVDFYVNDGTNQPGCFNMICSHMRVNEVYGEIISGVSVFTATPCRTTAEVDLNLCMEDAPSISLSGMVSRTNMPSKIYRFDTTENYQFSAVKYNNIYNCSICNLDTM